MNQTKKFDQKEYQQDQIRFRSRFLKTIMKRRQIQSSDHKDQNNQKPIIQEQEAL